MYAETGLMYTNYFQNFSPDVLVHEDFYNTHKLNVSMDNFGQTSAISDYSLEEEGDLFKAPEPIIEELVAGIDPIPSSISISLSSCGDDIISLQTLNIDDIESIQNDLLSYKNDLLENETLETPFSDVPEIKIPFVIEEETTTTTTNENSLSQERLFQKCISSGYLSSMEWLHAAPKWPKFLEFPGVDFEAIYGMRRVFSEGDMKTLCSSNVRAIHSSIVNPQIINNAIEDRMQKLSRYRDKKRKRNFGRKIKYACRKALADNQPRIRGRFAKTDQ